MDIARGEAGKFMGREDELFRGKEYLLSSRTGPFIVYGPTGSGKTCFISKVATMTGKLDGKIQSNFQYGGSVLLILNLHFKRRGFPATT